MAPKRSSVPTTKKSQSSPRQATLAFRSTKRGAAAHSKAKGKTKAKTNDTLLKKSESDSDGKEKSEPVMTDDSASEDEEEMLVKKETLDMRDKAGTYKKYYKEVTKQMGWIPPIHEEGQTKIHHMLRVFDNTYEYGPCVGMTRLERWERANALGLKPPVEVRNILLTEQGSRDVDLVHPVFYGQVL